MIKKRDRIEWIDLARGIAIVAVVIGHSLGNYFPGYFGNFIFAFHMPIFFVLSGYLYRPKKYKRLLKNSFLNLLVPYVSTVFIELIILILFKLWRNPILAPSRTDSVKLFLMSAVYASGGAVRIPIINKELLPIGALWFLVAMFFATQIFNLIMSIKFKNHLETKRAILTIVLAVIAVESAKIVFLPFSIQPALLAQVFLYFGYLVRSKKLLNLVNRYVSGIIIILWLIDAKFNLFAFEAANANYIVASVVIGCLSSIEVMHLCVTFSKTNARILKHILTFWGAGSLIMLCFHLVDLDFIQIWPKVISLFTPYSYLFAICIGCIYRILFVTIFTWLIPRTPIFRSLYDNRKYPIKVKFLAKDEG